MDEICRVIHHKMGLEITPKHMSSVIATNVNDERNPMVRLIPLPIKNAVMKAVFDTVGERKSCLTLSNLGLVKLPQAMKPYNCGMLSYDDVVYINFIRNIRDGDLERHFFAVLREVGLPVTVESNEE